MMNKKRKSFARIKKSFQKVFRKRSAKAGKNAGKDTVVWKPITTPPELLAILQRVAKQNNCLLSSINSYIGWRDGELTADVRYDLSILKKK